MLRTLNTGHARFVALLQNRAQKKYLNGRSFIFAPKAQK
jgi:hypothetical protein